MKTILKNHLEQKRLRRNREERARKKGLAAKPKGKPKGKTDGPPHKPGDCKQWAKFGKCSRGEDCPYVHDPDKKGKQKRGRSSTPKGGKGGDRKRSASNRPTRGKSPSGKAEAKVCTFYLQGKCQNGSSCGFWGACFVQGAQHSPLFARSEVPMPGCWPRPSCRLLPILAACRAAVL